MTTDEIMGAVLAILPNATFGEDNEGQLVVYTDHYEAGRPTTDTNGTGSKTMDSNETLRRIRELYVPEGAKLDPEGNELSDLIHRLDEHLSAGGTPPEAWSEGPDAVGEEVADRLNQRIDQALLTGYRKATATNHATILRLEQEIYELRNGETLNPDGSHAVSCRCGQCVEDE